MAEKNYNNIPIKKRLESLFGINISFTEAYLASSNFSKYSTLSFSA